MTSDVQYKENQQPEQVDMGQRHPVPHRLFQQRKITKQPRHRMTIQGFYEHSDSMNQEDLQYIEEQRHFTKGEKNHCCFPADAAEQGINSEHRPKGHQKELQGGRILLAIDERKQTCQECGLRLP
jgi:hypothetical protein